MPSITNLATTTTALTAVEKADYVEKVKDIESIYFITSDYKQFIYSWLDAKIKDKEIMNKLDFSTFTNTTDLDWKMKNMNNKSRIKDRKKKFD